MLTSTLIARYGIMYCFDSYNAIDDLFSNSSNDPYLVADEVNDKFIKTGLWDLSVAIAPNGTCVIQTIVFKDKLGYERYKRDGVVLFDNKEI